MEFCATGVPGLMPIWQNVGNRICFTRFNTSVTRCLDLSVATESSCVYIST